MRDLCAYFDVYEYKETYRVHHRSMYMYVIGGLINQINICVYTKMVLKKMKHRLYRFVQLSHVQSRLIPIF